MLLLKFIGNTLADLEVSFANLSRQMLQNLVLEIATRHNKLKSGLVSENEKITDLFRDGKVAF